MVYGNVVKGFEGNGDGESVFRINQCFIFRFLG